ncbi:adult cuticle protein 1-like [Sabethes cyaneus]|uniref:adult cuticle protein 1-like n=1 Tax=Sabethes cyaneus TaxID=53552 RepID=UPI00237ED965|nr:adult cuticle protein 1-like [Sabethes cyaneus]
MKCFVALVIAAISLVAEGSVIPWVLPAGIAIPAPAGLAIPGATVIQSNPAPATVLIPAAPGPVTIDASGIPIVLAPGPVPAVVAVAPVPAPAATSLSATRGAVHVAPLPGHSVSQQQLNLAPAPGSE